MSTPEQFQADCKAAARALRRIQPAIRRDIAADVKSEVAEPLASDMRAALSGPYARALSGAVKARAAADPRIVIGGASRVVSGGARQHELVFGVDQGGGKGRARVPARAGRAGYSRASTNQFVPAHPFVFVTVSARGAWMLDAWADIVIKYLEKELDRG